MANDSGSWPLWYLRTSVPLGSSTTPAISERYRVSVFFELLRVHARNLRQRVEIRERAVVVAIPDDLLRFVDRQPDGVGDIGRHAPVHVHLPVGVNEVGQQDVIVVVGDGRAEL